MSLSFWRTRNSTEIEIIRNATPHLKKVPKHIALVLNERERLTLSHIAKVVSWCILAGIPEITLFDNQGMLKKKKVDLELAIQEQGKRVLSVTRSKVNIISRDEGTHHIVDCTRQFCQQIRDKQLTSKDLTVTFVNSKLYDQFSEVDVMIKFDSSLAMAGFPPWHLRLTEIFFCDSITQFCCPQFVQILSMYAGTVQRCGK